MKKFKISFRDLRPIELRGFSFFCGTYRRFGLMSALCQLSPLLTLTRYWLFRIPVTLLAIVFAISMVPRAFAQYSGAYVVPRPFQLWTGVLTNSQSTNLALSGAVLTNLLNYSGFHRICLAETVAPAPSLITNGTPSAATTNGTITLTAQPGWYTPGFTNLALGTNVFFASTNPFTWINGFIGTNGFNTYTNLDWQWADSVNFLAPTKLTVTGTNAGSWQIEVDAFVTP